MPHNYRRRISVRLLSPLSGKQGMLNFAGYRLLTNQPNNLPDSLRRRGIAYQVKRLHFALFQPIEETICLIISMLSLRYALAQCNQRRNDHSYSYRHQCVCASAQIDTMRPDAWLFLSDPKIPSRSTARAMIVLAWREQQALSQAPGRHWKRGQGPKLVPQPRLAVAYWRFFPGLALVQHSWPS